MSLSLSSPQFLHILNKASDLCFTRLWHHITANPSVSIFTASCALAAFIILNIYNLKLYRTQLSDKLRIFIHVLFPFMFVMFTYYSLRSRPQDPLYIMLNYFAFYWLAAAILKIPSRFYNISVKRCYSTVMWFIFISLILALYFDLLKLYAHEYRHSLKHFYRVLSGCIRFSLSFGIYIYLKKILPPLLSELKTRHKMTILLGIPAKFLATVFGIISFLWVIDVLSLDFRFMMTAGLVVLVTALLSHMTGNADAIAMKVYDPVNYTPFEWTLIKKNMVRLALVSIIFLFYTLGYNLLDISDLVHLLKKTVLIRSPLFKLTLEGLLNAILIFMLLKSLLFLVSKYMRVALRGGMQASDSASVEVLMSNLGMLVIIIVTMLMTGITWQIVVPIAGALGIGFGFGLQTILNNYVSGFILLFSKKVKIGDYVELPGSAGTAVGNTSDMIFGSVASIDMFATTVRTFDNIEIMVPNSIFISETIINYTRSDNLIRVRIPVGVSYSSDIELVQKLMYEAIDACDFVVKNKKPDVWFMEFGDSSLNFMVLFWLDMSQGLQTTAVRNVFLQTLWNKFKEHDIEIPFPQQDVWFRNSLITEQKEKHE